MLHNSSSMEFLCVPNLLENSKSFYKMSAGMNRSQGISSLKRKQPDSKSPIESLTEHERIPHNLIRSKQDMAIWTRDMKRETHPPDNVLNKSLKSLQAKKLIKEVVTIQKKGRKHYIATEFEPSKEITGGVWYVEGSLDTEFINFLKKHCVKIIYEQKIVTLEEILDTIRKSRAFNVEFTTQQIEEIVNALVLDDEILEVKSTGMGEINSNALVLDNERKQTPEIEKIFTFKNHPTHRMIQSKEPILPL